MGGVVAREASTEAEVVVSAKGAAVEAGAAVAAGEEEVVVHFIVPHNQDYRLEGHYLLHRQSGRTQVLPLHPHLCLA